MTKERRENNWVECAYDIIINGEEKKKREKITTFHCQQLYRYTYKWKKSGRIPNY